MNYFSLKFALSRFFIAFSLLIGSGVSFATPDQLHLTRLFPTDAHPSVSFYDSTIASPLLDTSHGKPLVIAPVANGSIATLDAETGVLVT